MKGMSEESVSHDREQMSMLAACRAYARMMNTLDYRHLEPFLSPAFEYESQWVLEKITTKAAYAEYIKAKLRAISHSGQQVWAEIAYAETYPIGPCVLLYQGSRERAIATVLVDMHGNQISRIDMCMIPSPEECRRTGEFPGIGKD
jgi:hypothetical protein